MEISPFSIECYPLLSMRSDFAITKDFLEDIRKNGILEPVLCEQRENAPLPILVDGLRRVMVARILNLPTIPFRFPNKIPAY